MNLTEETIDYKIGVPQQGIYFIVEHPEVLPINKNRRTGTIVKVKIGSHGIDRTRIKKKLPPRSVQYRHAQLCRLQETPYTLVGYWTNPKISRTKLVEIEKKGIQIMSEFSYMNCHLEKGFKTETYKFHRAWTHKLYDRLNLHFLAKGMNSSKILYPTLLDLYKGALNNKELTWNDIIK